MVSKNTVDKNKIRKAFRKARERYVASLSSSARKAAFSTLPQQCFDLLAPERREQSRQFAQLTQPKGSSQPRRIVAGYVAIGAEADPAKLLAIAHDAGCTTALPHITHQSAMRFLQWSPGDRLESGPFGLMQPSSDSPILSPDLIFVPLIAFDQKHMRLGQGAGHYDRALARLEHCVAVGLAWSMQKAQNLPFDSWDVPMDAILTEKGWD